MNGSLRVNIQINSFSDVSSRMYTGVVYLRFVLKPGIVKPLLVPSKCKISSIKANVTMSQIVLGHS